jgi:hypothetical protein
MCTMEVWKGVRKVDRKTSTWAHEETTFHKINRHTDLSANSVIDSG